MTALAPAAPAPSVALDRPAPNARTIMHIMEGQADRLASCATKHLTPEKLIRMIGVQMQRVPKLGTCTPISVLECAMTLSELGLSPGVLGDAYLIPYSNTCTVIVGYRGLLKLARRSGHISTVQAEVVREGDEFQWRFGMDAALSHVPKADTKAKMTHAWAMAKFRDGSYQFVVLREAEINDIRKRSKAGNNGPWVTDTAEMWKKTALRRLCKMLPLTPEIEQQIAVADKTEFNFEDLGIPMGADVTQPTAGEIADQIGKRMDPGISDEVQHQAAEIAAKGGAGATDVEARREKLREQAEQLKAECSPENEGCAKDPADYSTVDGRKVCANHATSSAPSGDSLPGMAAPAGRRKR
jgi:recombination protein RecT